MERKKLRKGRKNNVQIYNAGETHRCPFVQGTADLYRTCCSSRNGRRRSFYKKIIDDTPHVSTSDVKPKGFTTFVYADDGSTEIERFVSSGSNRVYKSIDEIPKNLQHAFVAIEDERFYKHNGIDLQGMPVLR